LGEMIPDQKKKSGDVGGVVQVCVLSAGIPSVSGEKKEKKPKWGGGNH